MKKYKASTLKNLSTNDFYKAVTAILRGEAEYKTLRGVIINVN